MRQFTDLELTLCTAQAPTGEFCGGPSLPDAPFPLCGKHAREAYEFGSILVKAKVDLTKQPPVDRRAIKHERRVGGNEPCVYFIQVGDTIKIGASNCFANRMQNYPPTRIILHVEYRADAWLAERKHHQWFKDHLVGGHEWFAPHPEILAFIESRKARVGSDSGR